MLTTLYGFTAVYRGGVYPSALIQGSDSSFYGTTNEGGSNGAGTVFTITPAGALTTLYSVPDGSEGPPNALVQGSDGNFYGTTGFTVFSITPAGVLSTLHSFSAPDEDDNTNSDGYSPNVLVLGSDGNFYGTTSQGGSNGAGTVFRMTPAGMLTTLHTFTGSGTDGGTPEAGLVEGSDGNFYGTTFGLNSNGGVGSTIFSITPAGVLTTLHGFSALDASGDNGDGSSPNALVLGSDGNFYGTTYSGGSSGDGTIFSISTAGVFTTLYSFAGADGRQPASSLIQGSDNAFYGTTVYGGINDSGTVFKLDVLPSAGTLQFASTSYNTLENAGSVTLTVSRVGGSAGTVSAVYETADATASTGIDYTATSGTVSWADGDATDKTITLSIVDRSVYDNSSRTFSVLLSTPTGGAALGANATTSVNILENNVAPQPTITIASPPDQVTLVSGASVPFAASVNDPGGLLSSVGFTLNSVAVYQSTGHGPFVYSAKAPATLGAYTLVATATDNQGRTSTSTVTLNVVAPVATAAPTAQVLSPIGGRDLEANATVNLTFSADAASGTTLAQASLYADGVLVHTFAPSDAVPSAADGRPTRRDAIAPGNIFQTTYQVPGADKIVNLILVALDALGRSTVSPGGQLPREGLRPRRAARIHHGRDQRHALQGWFLEYDQRQRQRPGCDRAGGAERAWPGGRSEPHRTGRVGILHQRHQPGQVVPAAL